MLKPLCGSQLWQFLKIWEYQTTLPASLLDLLYAGQENIVRTRQGKTDWFKIGKGEGGPKMVEE